MDDIRTQITRSKLRGAFDYWDSRRAGLAFPSRSAIDPLELGFALGNLMLIDVLCEPLRFRYRLVGTGIVERWGYDMTGKFVDELPDRERLALVLDNYRTIVESQRPLAIRGERILDGRSWIYESVMMPLGETGRVNMLLVCVEYTASREKQVH